MDCINKAIIDWSLFEGKFIDVLNRDVFTLIYSISINQYTLSTTPISISPITKLNGFPGCVIHFLQSEYEITLHENSTLSAEINLTKVMALTGGELKEARRKRLHTWELDRLGNILDSHDGSAVIVDNFGPMLLSIICQSDPVNESIYPNGSFSDVFESQSDTPDFVIVPDEEADRATPDEPDVIIIPRPEAIRIRDTLVAWWASRRPPGWSEADHLKSPSVYLAEIVDVALAHMVADIVDRENLGPAIT